MNNHRSNGELKAMAREMLLGHYKAAIGAMLLASLIPSVILMPFQYLYESQRQDFTQQIIWVIVNILVFMLQMMFTTGLMHIHLKFAYHVPAKLTDLFWICKNRPDRALLGGLLFGILEVLPFVPAVIFMYLYQKNTTWLAVIVILFAAGAAVSIYLAFRYAFVFMIYAENGEVSTVEAFRISASLTKKAKGKLFVMYVSFIGWGLLCLCTLGIGVLWVSPYLTQSVVNFYLEQKHAFDVRLGLRQRVVLTPNS